MGMKHNSGHFHGTNGSKRGMLLPLDIQLFAKVKIPLRGRILLRKATDRKLKNTIKELYRPGAKIGDGGTAAAIKYQIKTGKLVGGHDHIQKGRERVLNLERFLRRKDITKKDRRIAIKLHKELKKALGEK